MLEVGRMPQQFFRLFAGAVVLGGYQIRHAIRDLPIFAPGNQPLGARQIVMKEEAIAEFTTNGPKKQQCLFLAQRSPAGKRNLKHLESQLAGKMNPVDNLSHRSSDDANLRFTISSQSLLSKNRDYLLIDRLGKPIPFTCRAQDIERLETPIVRFVNVLCEQHLIKLPI